MKLRIARLNIELTYAKMLANQKQIGMELLVNDIPISYLFTIDDNQSENEDSIDGEIYRYLKDLYDSGELEYEKPSDADILELKSFEIREKRDLLLEETDKYFMISDMPNLSEENLALLKTYRQLLRDIPQQAGFPNEVIFPERPVFLGESRD